MTGLLDSLNIELKKIWQSTHAVAVCPAFFVFFGLYIFAQCAISNNGARLFYALAIACVCPFCLIIFTSRVHYKAEISVSILIMMILFVGLAYEFYFIKNKFAYKDKTYVLHNEYAIVKSVRKWGKGQAIVFEVSTNSQKGQKFVLYHWGKATDTGKLYPIGATYSVSGLCHPFVAKAKAKKNAKQFDQWKFWQGHGVSSCLTPSREPQMVLLPTGLFAIRQILREEINATFQPKSRNYMEIFLLGERGKSLESLYKKSGTLHLMAISGFHVGLLLASIYCLFKNKFLCFFAGTFLLWCYVLLTGCPVSALRAAIMVQTLLFSFFFDLPRNSLNSVCIAGCLILLSNPFYVADVGFTLSFVCVLFLAAMPNKFIRDIFSLCIVSALLWIITAPILAYYFGSVSLFSILGNIFVLPVFCAVFPWALLLCFASLLFPSLSVFSCLLEVMLTSFEEYVSVFAKLPAIDIYQTAFLTASACLIFFVTLFHKLTANKAKSVVFAIFFSIVVLIFTFK